MEVAQHKTANRTAPVPAAAAHSQAVKLHAGAGNHKRFPSPSTRKFAESGILGESEVAKYLAMKGEPVRIRGNNKLRNLSEHEQRHDNASEKLGQTEKAVVIPLAENQSINNAGQIDQIDSRKTPAPAENKVKQQLQTSLADNIPQTIEEVDNFKRDNKARQMGNAVMSVVQGDKNEVVSTFSEMEETPQPAPAENISPPLPAEEKEPATLEMNLGQGAVAPLQPQHTDVGNFTKKADGKLKEEGITQEQLDMVDSGDLATANKEKKGMEKMAKSEPQSIQNFADQEAEKVNRDLKGEEKKERNTLNASRKADLSATSMKQKNTKNALEKKREEVAKQINSMYSTAQKSVVRKLSDLETKSMKNFGINFLKHLKNSLFEWLTGTLEGLVLPQVWDLKGIVGLALQMIGITYQNIRRHMVNVMGETVVSSVEKTFTMVKTLITEGPMAAWEQLKEMAGEMQQALIEAVKDFLRIKIIEQALLKREKKANH